MTPSKKAFTALERALLELTYEWTPLIKLGEDASVYDRLVSLGLAESKKVDGWTHYRLKQEKV